MKSNTSDLLIEKYQKLLKFVKALTNESIYENYENLNELNWVAYELLSEIGEIEENGGDK